MFSGGRRILYTRSWTCLIQPTSTAASICHYNTFLRLMLHMIMYFDVSKSICLLCWLKKHLLLSYVKGMGTFHKGTSEMCLSLVAFHSVYVSVSTSPISLLKDRPSFLLSSMPCQLLGSLELPWLAELLIQTSKNKYLFHKFFHAHFQKY